MNTQVARKMPIKSKNRLKNNIDLKKKKKNQCNDNTINVWDNLGHIAFIALPSQYKLLLWSESINLNTIMPHGNFQ